MKQTNLLEFSLVMPFWFVDHKALHSYSYFITYLLLYNTYNSIIICQFCRFKLFTLHLMSNLMSIYKSKMN